MCNGHLISHQHEDVIKWKHFPRYWPFVRGIHRSPVNSQHKGQCRGALMFSLISVWINDWINNREDGDLRRYRAHYDVIVMTQVCGPIDCSRHFGDVISQPSPFNRCLYLMRDVFPIFPVRDNSRLAIANFYFSVVSYILGVETFNVIMGFVYITRLCKSIPSVLVTTSG